MTAVISPELFVRHGRAAVDFYKAAFGAVELQRVGGTDTQPELVAQLDVGGATFWVHDEAPEQKNVSPESAGGCTVRLLLVVAEPQSVFDSALAAGATELSPVSEEHGWLVGRLRDPFGHHWEIGKPLVSWPHDGG